MPWARLVQVDAVISQEAGYLFDFTITYYMELSPLNTLTHTFVGLPYDDFPAELANWATGEGFQFR